MPKKYNWDLLLEKSWKFTKILFALIVFGVFCYGYGTFKPNSHAKVKINAELDKFYMNKIKEMDLQEPEFTYTNETQFMISMHKCINYINFNTPKHLRVPYEMIIGQAALESGWGTSRFAKEANNLFGIRTWTKSQPHLLPQGIDKWPGWGVRVFASKCDSVKEYVRLLNEHPAYEEFRKLREKTKDSLQLIKTLDAFSTTKDYDERVARMIFRIRELEKN